MLLIPKYILNICDDNILYIESWILVEFKQVDTIELVKLYLPLLISKLSFPDKFKLWSD